MKYAVAYISFSDNDLQLKIVEASSWKGALLKAFKVEENWLTSDDQEEAQEEAFNQDWLFEVVEIV